MSNKYRGTREYLVAYAELITAARYSGTTTYQAVAEIMDLPPTGSHMGKEVGQMLNAISVEEASQNRPMLTAIVVGVDGFPGPGFYGLARELGRLTEKSPEAEREFWEQEKRAVYDTWARTFKS